MFAMPYIASNVRSIFSFSVKLCTSHRTVPSADRAPINKFLKFLNKSMKRHGCPQILVTDKRRFYGAAMKDIGNA